MNIKDKLSELAIANGWTFDYGRSDYHNLRDAANFKDDTIEGYSNDETILFLDPVRQAINPLDNRITSSGQMIVITRSNLDKDYSDRYSLFIEPLIAEMKLIHSSLRCSFDITAWNMQEVINFFDYNADGLIINFTVIGDE